MAIWARAWNRRRDFSRPAASLAKWGTVRIVAVVAVVVVRRRAGAGIVEGFGFWEEFGVGFCLVLGCIGGGVFIAMW
jgi:hypothetical protein